MELITLVNGSECTPEFYNNFCSLLHITPNEFIEMGINPRVFELEDGAMKVSLTEDGNIIGERIDG